MQHSYFTNKFSYIIYSNFIYFQILIQDCYQQSITFVCNFEIFKIILRVSREKRAGYSTNAVFIKLQLQNWKLQFPQPFD